MVHKRIIVNRVDLFECFCFYQSIDLFLKVFFLNQRIAHACTHACTHTRTHTDTHTHACTRARMRALTHTHTHPPHHARLEAQSVPNLESDHFW